MALDLAARYVAQPLCIRSIAGELISIEIKIVIIWCKYCVYRVRRKLTIHYPLTVDWRTFSANWSVGWWNALVISRITSVSRITIIAGWNSRVWRSRAVRHVHVRLAFYSHSAHQTACRSWTLGRDLPLFMTSPTTRRLRDWRKKWRSVLRLPRKIWLQFRTPTRFTWNQSCNPVFYFVKR